MVSMLTVRPGDHLSTPEAATGYLTAATGERRVTINAFGHQPVMGEGKVGMPRRNRLRHDLTRETRRLMQHINHLSAGEVRLLESFVGDLEGIHDDDEACLRLARNHSDEPPPWGTRYANALERAVMTVFQKRRR